MYYFFSDSYKRKGKFVEFLLISRKVGKNFPWKSNSNKVALRTQIFGECSIHK